MNRIEHEYTEDGVSASGSKIPNLPVVDLVLRATGRKQALAGPALVDTGFDGGIYANLAIASYLEGLKPVTSESLGTPGHAIECEVYQTSCRLSGDHQKTMNVGRVNIYVPTDPGDLTEIVLVGREVVNSLELTLDGRNLRAKRF